MRITPSLTPFLALAAAAGTASAYALPPRHLSPVAAAEEIHTDAAGNLVWSDDKPALLADLQRPDFSSYQSSFGQSPSSSDDFLEDLKEDVAKFLAGVHEKVDSAVDSVKQTTSGWLRQAQVYVDGMEYQRLTHHSFPEYALRISSSTNSSICDPNVKQYSGYLDISETKHLWFVFFEARHKPEKAPLTMWLNGGPGCSSSTGLLFELGPCTIADGGDNVVNNPYSWTNKANMIFLDQPVNVGYSYSEDSNINNSPAAAEDVYAFLQLFLQKYPEYSQKPFTIAGESYGGHYIPQDAAYIYKKNQELAATKSDVKEAVHINLESIAIGNGLTEPLTQFASTVDFACSPDNEYALFKNDSSTCASLAQKAKTCSSLIEACYKYDNRLTCLPASIYCWSNLYSPLQDTGKNLYDVRKSCDRSKDGNLCYKEMEWMEVYMNKPEVMKAWGAHKGAKFQSCNMQVNQAFLFQGDGVRDSATGLIPLIEDGVRVLIYNGVTDAMCNHYGNEAWISKLPTSYLDDFTAAKKQDWIVDGSKAGWIKKAGKGAGSVAYLHVFEAGHMVPHDQPVAALQMWEDWLANKELA